MTIDIDLCMGTNCPLRKSCLRYLRGQEALKNNTFPSWWAEPAYDGKQCKNRIITKNKK